MRARHGMAAIGAALVVLASLAACSPPEGVDERVDQTVPPAAAAAAEPVAAPQPVTLDPGLVVATGELRSEDSLSSGRVSIVSADNGGFELVIDDFASPVSNLAVNVTTDPFTEAGYCAAAQIVYVLGTPVAAPRIVVPVGIGDLGPLADPSFLDTVLLTVNDNNAPKTGCFYPVFASTEIDWTMPDIRPDIRVADSGYTGGATGLVQMHGDRIGSYTVAAGDVLPEIAARFGLSVEDLLYLSPGRIADGDPSLAFADEVLNLDTSTR